MWNPFKESLVERSAKAVSSFNKVIDDLNDINQELADEQKQLNEEIVAKQEEVKLSSLQYVKNDSIINNLKKIFN